MELLSAVASVIALTQGIEKLFETAKFAKSVGQIPQEYVDVVEEVTFNRKLAENIGEHIKRHHAHDGQTLGDVCSRLRATVNSLERITEAVKKTPKTPHNGRREDTTVISTFRWQMNKREIAQIREEIKQTKFNLELCLQLLVLSQG